jgi:large subunit ribosomal protein L23
MEVLIKPIITEKMTAQGEKLNCYGFIVNHKANKLQIKDAVEKMYGVTVREVRTQNYIGKIKTRNTKAGIVTGVLNRNKKAIVSLKDGDMIDFYSNI